MALNNKKIYYSMGEVAEMFDVNPSLIRYWESKFSFLTPGKNSAGKRAFTEKDIENIKVVYHLVKEKGMTLEGAQKQIKENKSGVRRDMEIMERLMSVRSMLMEIRQELKDGTPSIDAEMNEIVPVGYSLDEPVVAEAAAEEVANEVVNTKTETQTVDVEMVFDEMADDDFVLEEPEESEHQNEFFEYEDSDSELCSDNGEQYEYTDSDEASDHCAPQPRIVEQMLF